MMKFVALAITFVLFWTTYYIDETYSIRKPGASSSSTTTTNDPTSKNRFLVSDTLADADHSFLSDERRSDTVAAMKAGKSVDRVSETTKNDMTKRQDNAESTGSNTQSNAVSDPTLVLLESRDLPLLSSENDHDPDQVDRSLTNKDSPEVATDKTDPHPGLRGLSVQRLLPYFPIRFAHSSVSKNYKPPKTSHSETSPAKNGEDCEKNPPKGKGDVKGKSLKAKSAKGGSKSKKGKSKTKCSGHGCQTSSKGSSKCEPGKGCYGGSSKFPSSKGSSKCSGGKGCGTSSKFPSSKTSSKCGSGPGGCGKGMMMSPKSSKHPVKCPTMEPTSNVIEDKCEKECMDWVYENCVVLDEHGKLLDDHCVIPFPFDDDMFGRSLGASANVGPEYFRPEDELQYHRRMVGIFERVLASIN